MYNNIVTILYILSDILLNCPPLCAWEGRAVQHRWRRVCTLVLRDHWLPQQWPLDLLALALWKFVP